MTSRPLLITPGEPAGIGSEIALKVWQGGINDICLIEQPAQIAQMAASLGITAKIREIDDPTSYNSTSQDLHVIPISWKTTPVAGAPDPANAPQVIDTIRQAALWSQSGAAAGIVTNPIQKSSLYDAGFAYPGHTEYLAALGGVLVWIDRHQPTEVDVVVDHHPLGNVTSGKRSAVGDHLCRLEAAVFPQQGDVALLRKYRCIEVPHRHGREAEVDRADVCLRLRSFLFQEGAHGTQSAKRVSVDRLRECV